MPLGTEVGLGLRNIVFDVDPVTPRKKAHPPQRNFGSCLFWPNGWMDEDAAGTEVDLGPGHIVLYGVPAPAKGAQQPPFSAHVYCGHGRLSQLLLSSCTHGRPETVVAWSICGVYSLLASLLCWRSIVASSCKSIVQPVALQFGL